jgi:hypothetical protein
MSRIRLVGALAVAIIVGACQQTGVSPSIPSGVPTSLPPLPSELPSGLESLLPSELPSLPTVRQSIAQFEPVNDSGITGGALFLDQDAETIATVGAVAPGEAAPLMPRIVAGACADVTDTTTTVAALPDLVAGASNGSIPMPLDDLAGSHAIVLLRGEAPPSEDPNASAPAESPSASAATGEVLGDLGELVACADIPAPGGG